MRVLAGAYILICALLLPGGMSRTGWIGAAAGCGVVAAGLYGEKFRRMDRRRRAMIIAGIAAVALAGGAGAYVLKPDSAAGRLLLWKIAAKAAAAGPAGGVGWENVAGAYGDAQEAYFASGEATAREEMLAGTPAYAFNEYLQMAIAYGPAAGVAFAASLLVAGLIYWRRREYGLAGVMVALMAVCFASYPLQFREFQVLIGAIVVGSGFAVGKWRSGGVTSQWAVGNGQWAGVGAMAVYVVLWGGVCLKAGEVDVNAEFAEAQRAQRIGRYEESNRILREILPKTSDPMPLNLMGKNYQAMGMRDSAEYCFRRAALRVPNRLYPHYLLMKLYAEREADSLQRHHEAQILLTKQPKAPSTAVEEMRSEAERALRAVAEW